MKLIIDTDTASCRVEENGAAADLQLYSPEAFEAISRQWIRTGWALRYYMTFTWMGRPIFQLPEDLIRLQEVIFQVRPDVIIETGICYGGSMLFHASLCEAMGQGRVIGIDINISPDTQAAVERSPLGRRITLIKGDSTSPDTVTLVKQQVHEGEKVLLILDSHHAKEHVLAELNAYAPLVSCDSCVVVTDGIMHDLADVPGGESGWTWDNPRSAARAYLAAHPEFVERQPQWRFHESPLEKNITYWPEAWLWRTR